MADLWDRGLNIGGFSVFKTGDKVVHPSHGAGKIEKTTFQKFNGDEEKYLVLAFSSTDLKVSLPESSVDKIGLRRVSCKSDANKALCVLESLPVSPNKSSNINYIRKDNLEKTHSGDICKVAEVIRDLSKRDKEKAIPATDKRILEGALKILSSEVALSFDVEEEEATKMLATSLSSSN